VLVSLNKVVASRAALEDTGWLRTAGMRSDERVVRLQFIVEPILAGEPEPAVVKIELTRIQRELLDYNNRSERVSN